ncbi:MAG: hypothetical protein ACM3X3_09150, partial [Betaproteobacteria bacterium]
GDEGERTLSALLVTDVIWAATWSWALARIVADVPRLAEYMALLGWALLGAGVLIATVRGVASRLRRGDARPRRR